MDEEVCSCVPTGLGPGFFNWENILAYQNAMLIIAAWSLTEMLSRGTRRMSKSELRELILTIMPVILCLFFVFATANWQPQATSGERVLLGVILGTSTVWGHKLAKSTGLHDKVPVLKLLMREKTDEQANAKQDEAPSGKDTRVDNDG